VRLDSGIDGSIEQAFLSDSGGKASTLVSTRQTIQALVLHVIMDLERDYFLIELSTREHDLREGDYAARRIRPDEYWDMQRYEKDAEIQRRKKRAEVNKTRRVIKHPNFHDFNTAQAENYLDKQQRGDVVIRPSSKGLNHLAVTWKVDDKLYQHIGKNTVTDCTLPSSPNFLHRCCRR
jgi:transcription elongation factor SPT6